MKRYILSGLLALLLFGLMPTPRGTLMAVDLTEGTQALWNAIRRVLMQHDVDIKRLWRRQSPYSDQIGEIIGEGSNVASSSGSSSTASSSTTTPSSSSTPAGSSSSTGIGTDCTCIWLWDGDQWLLVKDATDGSCEEPASSGSFIGEMASNDGCTIQIGCCAVPRSLHFEEIPNTSCYIPSAIVTYNSGSGNWEGTGAITGPDCTHLKCCNIVVSIGCDGSGGITMTAVIYTDLVSGDCSTPGSHAFTTPIGPNTCTPFYAKSSDGAGTPAYAEITEL